MTAARWLVASAAIALVGCPKPPPGAKTGSTPAPRSARTSTTTPAPRAPSSPSPDATPTVAPIPTEAPAPTGAPSPSPSEPALAPGEVLLRAGTLLRPQRKLAIGLVEVRRRPALVAWLAIGIGEMAYRVHLVRGDTLHAGDVQYRVAALSPTEGVTLALTTPAPAGRRAAIADAPTGRLLTLPTMGLYRLADGRVIGVGNARAVGLGAQRAPRVPITVYPKGYAKNPVLEYDLFEAAAAKQRVKGKVATLGFVKVVADGAERGSIEVRLLR